MTPPTDPRDPPAFGTLPAVARLDELTDRVVAPNMSAMTLDGTNTLLVGDRGSGAVVVVDPGPPDDDHLDRIRTVAADRDAEVVALLLTHHHHDHSESAPRLAAEFGCAVHAARPDLAIDAPPLDDTPLRLAGTTIVPVATPGHASDHVSFRLATGALCTGDHVLGRGTSVVAHPDGDLLDYLESLQTVLALGPDSLFPGHGPEMTEDPTAVVEFYLAHRHHRLAQIVDTLTTAGPSTPRELVEVIYADHDPSVWGAAEASTRAALDLLVRQGAVARDGDGRVATNE